MQAFVHYIPVFLGTQWSQVDGKAVDISAGGAGVWIVTPERKDNVHYRVGTRRLQGKGNIFNLTKIEHQRAFISCTHQHRCNCHEQKVY